MKNLTTKDLKVKFLGITPFLEDKTGNLDAQETVAFSALITFKGTSVQSLLKEVVDKGQDVNEKIKNILRKSSLKGHASMATTPVICFSYEASKFLDSAITGIIFSSSLMASGRRTDTTIKDIVYPSTISKNKKAKEIYRKASDKNIIFFNSLLNEEVQKDEASKILQYGIYGTGIVQLPIESIVSLKKEYEECKEWMPEEIGLLLKEIEKELKKYGVDLLYTTRIVAPRNTYPYPHIFRNPEMPNIVRDLSKKKKTKKLFEIISSNFVLTEGLKRKLRELKKEIQKVLKNKKTLKKEWLNLLSLRSQIARDYANALNIKILSSVAWRVWGDKKRHRTVPMVVDSVYYSVQRAAEVFKKYKKQIKEKKLKKETLDNINLVFSIPPTVRANKELLYSYLERCLDSLEVYNQLISLGVKERDAIFIIPRGLKLDVLQEYNLYNLIAGYYPLRICSSAEEELRKISVKEVGDIKNLLKKKGYSWLAEHIVPKCHVVGFCLEEESCGMVKTLSPNYDEKFHEEMKRDLEDKFQKNLNNLGK
ncbi:MAG: FAD-dependent thymidylate synthase [Candidatus Pacebacteria bacterium]|nr:FAD-dependent thymidylate synthase [Candidatus Paceibacterota bacterium]